MRSPTASPAESSSAQGVALDLRKDKPYSGYEQYEFDVPVGSKGDSYDRYLCRGEEMRQSVRIIRQVIAKFPGGDWYAKDARKIFAPPKDKILTSMEELINNFMIVTEARRIQTGEVYFEAENPKGILGFYIVSKGGGVPWRMKIRSPSFCNLSILPKVCVGTMMSDVVTLLGSLDFVMGECDRYSLSRILLDESSGPKLSKIDKVITHYPTKRSATLPLLHLIQEDIGHLPGDASSGSPKSWSCSRSTCSKSSRFTRCSGRSRSGRRHIKVCRTLSCALVGGYKTCATFEKEFHAHLGEVSPDGEVTGRFRRMSRELRHGTGRADRRRTPREGRRRESEAVERPGSKPKSKKR